MSASPEHSGIGTVGPSGRPLSYSTGQSGLSPTHARNFSCTYLATKASVGIARKAAMRTALAWGFTGEKVDDVCLVVSELVTNSVTAASHGEIRVSLAEDVSGHITVEVWDGSDEMPQRKPAAPTDLGGRGLWIVGALAVHSGVRQGNGGKVVYAVL
ncbi:ATP-binding protein [Actinomadura darangshiensis]|uniref:ATP-binding protein n=1 Tax=Actinomadura darangshiensis TaxID=705336 RepID=A0A4R5BUA5_9ACTN|nr:ATP-binding protein [Actinomadura darangshiensis]TDD88900.1 ATP-binding protein [Actinomadura darangshiensis]